MSSDRLLPAIGLRLLSVGLFATMNAAIKLAEAKGARLGEILFFRQFGAAILVTGVIAAGPGLATIRTQRLGAHVSRATVGVISMAFTFAALLLLPLAEATTIGFSTPIFATILGALILGEPTGWRRWSAVAVGFVGVLIVLEPGGHAMPLAGAACGLAAAVLTAVVFILLRQIGRTERAQTTVWWFSVLSLLPLGIVYAFQAQPHAAGAWAALAVVGVAGGCAQLAMTASLRRGAVSLVVPFDYTALLWATIYGWLLFGSLPGRATWLGAPIIVASGLYIVWREHVRRREETRRALSEE
ncbi:membrane protein [Sphingomonas metalli]|uniref:Membrane protein n=1 Tax=Sphingomonas metalli TaxID=1779358 RepID=A0A916STF6_9SPHN|nr:DMT family transporter [Sphingomonas metalli]GGB15617.1 membrane protein [Sphingomonas metalli]